MGFFSSGRGDHASGSAGMPSTKLLHKLECRACPLNDPKHDGRKWHNENPHIPAAGSKKPLVYILGEAPGAAEDANNAHFIGKSGQLLRARIPKGWDRDLRWNNVVRTRPPENRTPTHIEMECCRPSIVRDIEQTKPAAIFGFGGIPLEWATGLTALNNWRGRRLPVKVGEHECWFYSFHHPAYILRARVDYEKRRNKEIRSYKEVGPEDDRVFKFDIERAFEEVEGGLPKAHVISPIEALQGVSWLVGENGRRDLEKLASFLDWAAAQPVVGLDYETDRLRPYAKASRVLSVGIGTPTRTLAFSIDHPKSMWGSLRDAVVALFVKFLRSKKVRKAVHNLAFECEWTSVKFDEDCLIDTAWEDTMSQAAVLDERTGRSGGQRKKEQGPLSLDFLIRQYFGLDLKGMSKLDRKNLASEPVVDVLRYNGLDAKFHCLLHLEQIKRLEEEGKLLDVYQNDLLAVPAMARTQIKGVPVDQTVVKELSVEFTAKIKDFDKTISEFEEVAAFRKLQNKAFNPDSTHDMTILVRDIMKCRDGLRDGGRYSVDEETLLKIDHPVAKAILGRRKITKLKSTYNDSFMEGIGEYLHEDGMLHPIINTTVARTGRTSSEKPNEQNMPKREAYAKRVRRQVKAPKGHLIAAFDYGQIQARNIAMESKDEVFVKALWERYDVHTEWAQRISRAYPDRVGGKEFFTDKKVMKDFRGDVKNQWTFPLFFGAQLRSVAEYLKVPEDKLKPLYEEFWQTFHGVKDWQERLVSFYRKHGYVESLDGRRRRAPLTQNQIFNSPIQADEACIVKDAQTRLSRTKKWVYQSNLLIHDDLTFVLPVDEIDDHAEFIIGRMLDVRFPWVNVPITVEMSIGQDWEHMDEIGNYSSDQWDK